MSADIPHRRSRPVILLCAIAALVVLGAAVLAWLVIRDDEAQTDAEHACELVDRLPEELNGDGAEHRRHLLRLAAAQSLAEAAVEGDGDYDDLADAATKALREYHQSFKTSKATMDDLRSECDAL